MLEAGIVTASAAGLVPFYVDGLGFDVAHVFRFEQGTVHRLRRGVDGLKIFEPSERAEVVDRPEPWHRDEGFAYAALHTDDIETCFEAAVTAGAEVLVAPVRHRPGARYALIADPQGNIWELLEEPHD